jgi:hypothetical protein
MGGEQAGVGGAAGKTQPRSTKRPAEEPPEPSEQPSKQPRTEEQAQARDSEPGGGEDASEEFWCGCGEGPAACLASRPKPRRSLAQRQPREPQTAHKWLGQRPGMTADRLLERESKLGTPYTGHRT